MKRVFHEFRISVLVSNSKSTNDTNIVIFYFFSEPTRPDSHANCQRSAHMLTEIVIITERIASVTSGYLIFADCINVPMYVSSSGITGVLSTCSSSFNENSPLVMYAAPEKYSGYDPGL